MKLTSTNLLFLRSELASYTRHFSYMLLGSITFLLANPETCSAQCVGGVLYFPGLSNIQCNDNGTASDATDDFITFDLNPVGINTGSGYTILGITTTPAGGLFGGSTSFTMAAGSAGAGNTTPKIIFGAITPQACENTIFITDPGSCSNGTTATFVGNNTGGDTFMGEDPCSCNGDHVLNADGTIATPGTFSEVVTVTGPANLFIRVKTITDAAGNPFTLSDNRLTETPPWSGTYEIDFDHTDRLGYSITEFEYATTETGTYATVTGPGPGFTPVAISNVCAYPSVVCSPLASSLTTTDTPITLTLTESSTDISFTGTAQFLINNTVATVFDPGAAPVIVGANTVVGTYDIVAGPGNGGTLAAPAIPIDGPGTGVCPISTPAKTVQVSGVVAAATAIPTMGQWGLMIFGLLILNLGLSFVRRLELISII